MFKPVILIPCYNHSDAFANFAISLCKVNIPVIVIDDGSESKQSQKLRRICSEHGFKYVHKCHNSGKGGAMKQGFVVALELGYTHGLQIDADGQHNADDIPKFIKLAENNPDALIIGTPVYDSGAPKSRLIGRKITNFWVMIETMNRHMPDAMCGFRVYPLDITAKVVQHILFNRMGFDIEILVKLYWSRVSVIKQETHVIYPQGGLSNFKMLRDNIHIALLHTYLCAIMPIWMIKRIFKRKKRLEV